jgi:hypothetical protein
MKEAKQAIDAPTDAGSRFSDWMARNLATQGYHADAEERNRLRVGLRFATGLCLPLVAAAVLLKSPELLLALAGIGAVGGLTPRHPFDLLWNHGVRHVMGAPPLPPNPVRRRHAFKIGAALLLLAAALFAAGLAAAGLALGGVLLAACLLATTVNFCVPSFLLSVSARRHASNEPTAGACPGVDSAKRSHRHGGERARGFGQYQQRRRTWKTTKL